MKKRAGRKRAAPKRSRKASARRLDPAIEALDLAPVARAAAYALKRLHAEVVFTSGRRDEVAQAQAMAGNVVRNRQWIVQTYLPSPVCAACQKWVDEHPQALSQEAIQQGLTSVFDSIGEAEIGRISKHLSGEAFDVQPVAANAEAIKASIRALKGLTKFLDREGGLERWHAQF
ncbi:MAG TPA: hypothetical protein VGP97_19285 [Burkholderiales bacterium]|nr:hypothetical protein [Burkholderiales bacterium]